MTVSSNLLGFGEEVLDVVVCGGGNAAHVLLSYLGSTSGVRVHLLSIYGDEASRFKTSITSIHDNEKITGVVTSITSDPSKLPKAHVAIIAVPGFGHEAYFKAIKSIVDQSSVVGVLAAYGGMDWSARDILGDGITVFGMETLPWACRIEEYGSSVTVLGTKGNVDIAVIPTARREVVSEAIHHLIGRTVDGHDRLPVFPPLPNFLPLALADGVLHLGILYGKFHDWDGETGYDEVPLFYQGVDDYAADVLEGMTAESLMIRDAIVTKHPECDLSPVISLYEWFKHAYQGEMEDDSNLKNCLVTNRAYRGLKHKMIELPNGKFIPDVKYRYFAEDMPFGLVVQRGLAELAEVHTPNMDKVIYWAQGLMGKQYLVDGKLTGVDLAETRSPQRFSYSNLSEVIALYY